MLSYQGGDSTRGRLSPRSWHPPQFLHGRDGRRLATEALVGHRDGLIEAGAARWWRSFVDERLFADPHRRHRRTLAAPVGGDMLHNRAYGWQSAGQELRTDLYAPHVRLRNQAEQVAMVKWRTATTPPITRGLLQEALYGRGCAEAAASLQSAATSWMLRRTDNATAIIVTSAERARDCKHPLVLIRGVVGRAISRASTCSYQHGPISTVAGYYARQILVAERGVGPEDIDITGSYDALPSRRCWQLEDYGFCKKGEGANTSRAVRFSSAAGGRIIRRRPSLRGLHHGMNMVIENTRQLRHDA